MTDDRMQALERRISDAEEREKALVARLLVDGQAIELLLALLFLEKGPGAEEAIKRTLRNAKPDSKVVLSGPAAVWWSDSAVLIDPVRTALLERVEQQTARLRHADESPS